MIKKICVNGRTILPNKAKSFLTPFLNSMTYTNHDKVDAASTNLGLIVKGDCFSMINSLLTFY